MWRNDTKCKYMLMFPLKNLAHKELRVQKSISTWQPLLVSSSWPQTSIHKNIIHQMEVCVLVFYLEVNLTSHTTHLKKGLPQIPSMTTWQGTRIVARPMAVRWHALLILAIIGLGNGLAPIRDQDITWTNHDLELDLCCQLAIHMASLGLNELRK